MNHQVLTKCKINGINVIYKSQHKFYKCTNFSVWKGDSKE